MMHGLRNIKLRYPRIALNTSAIVPHHFPGVENGMLLLMILCVLFVSAKRIKRPRDSTSK